MRSPARLLRSQSNGLREATGMSSKSALPSWLERILSRLSVEEREELKAFFEALLQIRNSDASPRKKLRRTTEAVRDAKTLWPVLREVGRVAKQHTWDDRGPSMRWGMAGAGAALVLFGGQGVGIAAFGGAIGLPLWIVFGAGAALARNVVDSLGRRPD
jgi:hypothetical protein